MSFFDKISHQPDFIQIRADFKGICVLKVKMFFKKKSEIMPALILILVSIVLLGCSKNPEPDVAKTGSVNQSPAALNNNINQSPAVLNNNNVHAGSPNASTPIVNDTAASTVNKDKKPLPPVKAPTPNIGSGGSDIFLFTQARGALSSDKELSNAVIIEIKEGNVTLTGKVSSEEQKTKAGRLVQNVTGIKSVKNNLRVSS